MEKKEVKKVDQAKEVADWIFQHNKYPAWLYQELTEEIIRPIVEEVEKEMETEI